MAMMTEVHVGAEEIEKFVVRKDFATRHSSVIQKALDPENGWKEAKENIVRLPEESSEDFQVFVTFLNTGVIHINHFKGTDEGQAEGGDTSEEEWDSIAHAWLLGDRIHSTSFKDAIVDKVISLVRDHGKTPASMHRAICKGSVYKSGMRSLLADIAVHGWSKKMMVAQPDDPECAGFFKEIAAEALERTMLARRDETLDIAPYIQLGIECHYHDHDGEGKSCYKTMFE